MEHVKKREEISKEFTWALEDLYQDITLLILVMLRRRK